MLEIIALIGLGRWMASTLESKGYSRWFAAFGPVGWIFAELTGGCIGGLLGLEVGVYLLGIGLALCWAAVAATATVMLPSPVDPFATSLGTNPDAIRSNPWA